MTRAQTAEGREVLRELTAERQLGVYISGLPGVGKSTLLLHLILDDMQAGRGCCVIDPHGDLITDILARCPDDVDLLHRILLFDPSDTDWPIGLNLLDARTERSRELAVQFMIELFEVLFLPDQQGPMLHQSVRNGMRLLMQTGGSLAHLPLVFSDSAFLKKKLQELRDPWVRHYFESVWLEVKGSGRGEYLAYFTSKFSAFLDDFVLRNIVGQRHGPDLGRILHDGGVVLANLNRGAIGDLDARLLGMILLHKLERYAVERSSMTTDARSRIHVYVDEFHEFTTPSLVRFLGAARKFNFGIALAHQRLETLAPALREGILGAVGHAILFRQGPDDGFRALPRLVWPRFGERELLSLPNYQAVVRATGPGGTAHLGRLNVPPPPIPCDHGGERAQSWSRFRYAIPRHKAELAMLKDLGWNREVEKETTEESLTTNRPVILDG